MHEIRPRKIRLEASSICQLRCSSCPNSRGTILPVIGRGFLKLDDFRGLIEENPQIEAVELSNYGEVFLNPHLKEIIEYAYRKGVALSADEGVNLNSAGEEVLEALVRFNFRSMTCSIDGASSETYSVYRVRGDFDAVMNNIRKINFFKSKYRSSLPRMKWQFVVFGHNARDIEPARRRAAELGMGFKLKLPWDSGFSPVWEREIVIEELGVASREEYRQKHGIGIDAGFGMCHNLWDQPQINWDGKVLGCCRNFWLDFGANAFTEGLLNSVNSERMRYAREMLVGGKPERKDIPCATCNVYLDMKSSGKWLKRGLRALPSRLMRHLRRLT